MKEKLTDVRLRRMPAAPTGKRVMVWDTEVGNFGVRVTDRVDPISKEPGRTFIVMRRFDGKLIRHKIGTYPAITLAAAREAARDINARLERGIDPKAQQRLEAAAAETAALADAQRKGKTFAAAAEAFIENYVKPKTEGTGPNQKRTRYSREMENVIRRELIGRWGPMPIDTVTDEHVADMISEITLSGRYEAARKANNHAKKLFGWVAARRTLGIKVSPIAALDSKEILAPKVRRKRVLSDAEIKVLWPVVSGLKFPFPLGPFVQFLLITGQRLREVADARWCEFDLEQGIWSIPAGRMKAANDHEVALSALALDLLWSLPRFDGSRAEQAGHFVFTTTAGVRPISGFSKFKKQLDEALKGVVPWRFHDLRRTMRTRLSGLPIAHNVAELVIAHAQSELDQIYDQHRYLAEKREAMRLWGEKLQSLVAPPKRADSVGEDSGTAKIAAA